MIMMTVKAMINFLFYQIWHFAASGSFYYQFHLRVSRDWLSPSYLACSRMLFLIETNLCFVSSYWNLYYLPRAFTCSPCAIYVRLDLLLLFLSFHLTDSLLYIDIDIYIYMILFVLSDSSSIIIGMNELRKRSALVRSFEYWVTP